MTEKRFTAKPIGTTPNVTRTYLIEHVGAQPAGAVEPSPRPHTTAAPHRTTAARETRVVGEHGREYCAPWPVDGIRAGWQGRAANDTAAGIVGDQRDTT
jgi:hypothetical protein